MIFMFVFDVLNGGKKCTNALFHVFYYIFAPGPLRNPSHNNCTKMHRKDINNLHLREQLYTISPNNLPKELYIYEWYVRLLTSTLKYSTNWTAQCSHVSQQTLQCDNSPSTCKPYTGEHCKFCNQKLFLGITFCVPHLGCPFLLFPKCSVLLFYRGSKHACPEAVPSYAQGNT